MMFEDGLQLPPVGGARWKVGVYPHEDREELFIEVSAVVRIMVREVLDKGLVIGSERAAVCRLTTEKVPAHLLEGLQWNRL
jgi:hypothetical protein